MSAPGRLAAALGGAAVVVLGMAGSVPLPERLSAAGSTEVRWADGSTAHVQLAPDQRWRIPARAEEVDPDYLEALQAVEDARFRWHAGVDPLAVARAAAQNLLAGEVRSGASTLTMQLVRMVEPRPRTLRSKVLEAARAVQLELRHDKDELLSAYLTFAPYGKNVEGVRAASFWYFGHDADALSPPEIATLLAVPQDPNRRYPCPENAARLRGARDALATRLWGPGGALPAPQPLPELLATPIPERIQPVPRALPHAAPWMSRGAQRVDSTLDRGVQAAVDRVFDGAHAELATRGIHNGAIVVIEHGTGEVRALAALDFWDREHGGQIPAFDIPRSPGSTLKPVLYAAAVDRGLVLPDTLVPDVPVRYRGYAPKNYDETWAGMVRLEDALSRSLNVPFVNLLSRFGVERFLAVLREGGAHHLDPRPGHYGLSAVVGGIELTPLELGGLYAALAGDGGWRSPRWIQGPELPPRPLYTPASAWLTRRALRLRDRPDFPARAQLARLPRQIHWKTGTSFANRDAWAVGSGEQYTAVVWLGNVDRTPSIHLVGADAAAPLLFDLLDALGDGLRGGDPAPADMRGVEVCALSGTLPGPACPERRTVPASSERVPTARCALHQHVDVDRVSGLTLTPGCRDHHPHETRAVVVWPGEVQAWLGASLRGLSTRPPLAPGCEAPATSRPRIRQPELGQVAVLVPGVAPSDQELPFEAESTVPGELAWFVDGSFLARAPARDRVWWTPSPGRHRVVVMDAAGGTDETRLEVRSGW